MSFLKRKLLSKKRLALILFTLVLVGFGARYGWMYYQFNQSLGRAQDAFFRGYNAQAKRELSDCEKVRPLQRDVLLLRGAVARRSGDWEQANSYLQQYWKEHGDDDNSTREWLCLFAARGDVDRYLNALVARVERRDAYSSFVREAMISGYIFRFRWLEADGQIGNWLKEDPDNILALMLEAKLLEQREQTSEAAKVYRRILELDPNHDEVRVRLVSIILSLSQGAEALGHTQVLIERLPDLLIVKHLHARALYLQARADDAKTLLEQVNRDNPNVSFIQFELGRLAALDGRDTQAEEFLANAVKLDPGNIQYRSQYAAILARNRKIKESVEQEKTIKQLEADSEAIRQLVSGKLQKNPKDPNILYEIATISMRAGADQETIRWLNLALDNEPNHLESHRLLSVFYREAGNPFLASKHRAIAQKLAPK